MKLYDYLCSVEKIQKWANTYRNGYQGETDWIFDPTARVDSVRVQTIGFDNIVKPVKEILGEGIRSKDLQSYTEKVLNAIKEKDKKRISAVGKLLLKMSVSKYGIKLLFGNDDKVEKQLSYSVTELLDIVGEDLKEKVFGNIGLKEEEDNYDDNLKIAEVILELHCSGFELKSKKYFVAESNKGITTVWHHRVSGVVVSLSIYKYFSKLRKKWVDSQTGRIYFNVPNSNIFTFANLSGDTNGTDLHCSLYNGFSTSLNKWWNLTKPSKWVEALWDKQTLRTFCIYLEGEGICSPGYQSVGMASNYKVSYCFDIIRAQKFLQGSGIPYNKDALREDYDKRFSELNSEEKYDLKRKLDTLDKFFEDGKEIEGCYSDLLANIIKR